MISWCQELFKKPNKLLEMLELEKDLNLVSYNETEKKIYYIIVGNFQIVVHVT